MKTILIADDEPNVRLLVSNTLGRQGYAVIQAADGEEAWALIQQHRPDLAILDVMMPGRDGYDLAQAIKDDPTLGDTRVIILSARAQRVDIETGMLAGADLYLTKPFSPRELQDAIAQVIA